MLPRECDNDNCDYETGVRNGRPAAWWVHDVDCRPENRIPPVEYVQRSVLCSDPE